MDLLQTGLWTLANSLLDRAERARWGSSLLIEGFTSDFAIFLPCSGSKLARHLTQFCYPKAEKAGSKDAFEKAYFSVSIVGWIQWQPKKGITNQWSPPLSNEAKSLVLCKAFTEFKTGIHAYSSRGWLFYYRSRTRTGAASHFLTAEVHSYFLFKERKDLNTIP